MNFYEFNDCGYYALIGAKDIDSAMDYYEEVVGDIEESDGFPDEVTKENAKLKLIKACGNNKEDVQIATADFEENSNKEVPFLVLIDGSLL